MTELKSYQQLEADDLHIGTSVYRSRLIVGTGKYPSEDIAKESIINSGSELVTLALKRYDKNDSNNILRPIGTKKLLPNTAGVLTADEAIRSSKISRELFQTNLIKLEIISSSQDLDPNMKETLIAAKKLVQDGFEVYVYCDRDVNHCLALEDFGCVAIMPLGASIGSGRGFDSINELEALRKKIEQILIVDAGLGAPSEAGRCMEMGFDAVLVNTAIAKADNPPLMAEAFKHAVESGRAAYFAGRIQRSEAGSPSSPTKFLS